MHYIGDLVLFSVDDVDKGPLDPNNILCYLMDDGVDGLYTLGSRVGVLDKRVGWNTFRKTSLEYTDFKITDVPFEKDNKGYILLFKIIFLIFSNWLII